MDKHKFSTKYFFRGCGKRERPLALAELSLLPPAMLSPTNHDESGSCDSEQSKQWAVSHDVKAVEGPLPVSFPPGASLATDVDVSLVPDDFKSELLPSEGGGGAGPLPALRVPYRHLVRPDSSGNVDRRTSRGVRLKCKYGLDTRVVAIANDATFAGLYARLLHDYGFELTMK